MTLRQRALQMCVQRCDGYMWDHFACKDCDQHLVIKAAEATEGRQRECDHYIGHVTTMYGEPELWLESERRSRAGLLGGTIEKAIWFAFCPKCQKRLLSKLGATGEEGGPQEQE